VDEREKMISQVKKVGHKFPSRQRFVLAYKEGKFSIITTENKGKIKLENEKISHNRSLLLDGTVTALIDIKDINSPEEYVDTLLNLHKRWGLKS
jgi:hypothetical protein